MTVINSVGNSLTGVTGSGNFVGANQPTLIGPVLGAATATSIGVGGNLTASSIVSLSSTTLGFLPPAMTTTQKNAISGPASGLMVYDSTLKQIQYYNGTAWVGAASALTAPTVQKFLTHGVGTYTKPAGVLYIIVECVGPGGGGQGQSGLGANGSIATTFGIALLSASPGTGGGGTDGQGGLGGVASGGDINITGGGGQGQVNGNNGTGNNVAAGGLGGSAAYGGGGTGSSQGTTENATPGSFGGGGGGATLQASNNGLSGGGAGGYCKKLITSPSATYAYVVGQGGAAGAGSSPAAAAGGDGAILVYEYYQ